MKERSKKIQQCVNKAKKYLAEIEKLEKKIGVYQADISELAIKACEIRHGGISNNIYTLKDFANDIGMHPKTLQNWVAAYRTVVPHVGRERIKSQKDWSDVRKTKRTVGDGADRKKVKQIFDLYNDEDSKEKPFLGEFRNSIAAAKHLKFMLGKRDLSLVDFSQWLELMNELDACSDLINAYLTKNKKKIAI